LKYRADIQGLRALAILPVVAFHADHRLAPGGFVGVDIFFVISGFLITGILARELEKRTFSIGGFYQRRVRRLFPALFAMLAASFACGLALLPPKAFEEFATTALAAVVFLSNFRFEQISDYFGGPAELKPLLHTWSLAVEEQFYLLFPPFLWAVYRWRRAALLPLLVVGALVSLALSVWLTHADVTKAFYLSPPRAFELLIGCILGIGAIPTPRKQAVRDILSLIGIVLIAASVVLISDKTPFPGIAVLAPCIGAALVIYAGQNGTSAGGRLISLPPLTFVGSLSYSLYLWHWPMLVFARYYFLGDLSMPQTAALMAAAFLISALSWRFIEQPVLKARIAPGRVLLAGLLAIGVGAAVAGAVIVTKGMPGRFSPAVLQLFASSEDFNHDRERCHSERNKIIPYARGCVFGREGAAPDTVVWGDSHGAELAIALAERKAAEGSSLIQMTASACPPALDYDPPKRPRCRAHTRETLRAIIADQRVHTVFMVSSYQTYFGDKAFQAGFARTAEALAAGGKRVVLVYPLPVLSGPEPGDAIGMLKARGADPQTFGLSRRLFNEQNRGPTAYLDALSARLPVRTIKPADALCGERFCPAYREGIGALYFNRTHVSVTGARLVAKQADEALFKAPAR
jgi:peptidoglycan/LPS O-acetylase OafA/YrhL